MTANSIAVKLAASRWHVGFAIPNYTPRNWWECDVFEVTKAGYFREYEIKLTRSDFRADAKKGKTRFVRPDPTQFKFEEQTDLKFSKIGDPNGPTKFWYVTTPNLVTFEEIPEWAGLIEIVNGREREIKPAPQLHRTKVDPKVITHARGVCYYRMMRMLIDKWYFRYHEFELKPGEGI